MFKNIARVLLVSFILFLGFKAGQMYQTMVLTERFERVAQFVVKRYENALGVERQKNDFCTGHQQEKYDL
jgi:hypothetical protein